MVAHPRGRALGPPLGLLNRWGGDPKVPTWTCQGCSIRKTSGSSRPARTGPEGPGGAQGGAERARGCSWPCPLRTWAQAAAGSPQRRSGGGSRRASRTTAGGEQVRATPAHPYPYHAHTCPRQPTLPTPAPAPAGSEHSGRCRAAGSRARATTGTPRAATTRTPRAPNVRGTRGPPPCPSPRHPVRTVH